MAWAPDYITAAELSGFLRIPDHDDDVQLGLAITAASRAIDRYTRRQFGSAATPEARFYTAHYDWGRDRWTVPMDDLMTAAGLTVAFDSVSDGTYSSPVTAYSPRPANAAVKSRPWTQLAILSTTPVLTAFEAGVKVTATWGWTAVPAAVKQACLLQASRIHARRDSPYGVAGSPTDGTELRLLARVDPDVEVALSDYRRRDSWVFA